MGKWLGMLKREIGLYFPSIESGTEYLTHTHMSENPTPVWEQIWLSHFSLGCPPFLLYKNMFPNMFEKWIILFTVTHYDVTYSNIK